jgi:hypothetical protein
VTLAAVARLNSHASLRRWAWYFASEPMRASNMASENPVVVAVVASAGMICCGVRAPWSIRNFPNWWRSVCCGDGEGAEAEEVAPCADLTRFPQPTGLLHPGFRRIGRPPCRWNDYNSDWTPLVAGLSPAKMATSLAAPVSVMYTRRHAHSMSSPIGPPAAAASIPEYNWRRAARLAESG